MLLRSAPSAARRATQPGFPAKEVPTRSVAVLGLGYVGLPTGIGLATGGAKVTGVDVSERRLQDIREGAWTSRWERGSACSRHSSSTSSCSRRAPVRSRTADAVFICVPTPVDERLRPDLRLLRAACATVVAHARRGQLILLTSTTYVGTTTSCSRSRWGTAGCGPGGTCSSRSRPSGSTPATGTGTSATCRGWSAAPPSAARARRRRRRRRIAGHAHRSPRREAAELCKLYENTFRAVNIGFANEMADASRALGLDPIEVRGRRRRSRTASWRSIRAPASAGTASPVTRTTCSRPARAARRRADPGACDEGDRRAATRGRRAGRRAAWRTPASTGRGSGAGGRRLLQAGRADTRESPGVRIMRGLRGEGARSHSTTRWCARSRPAAGLPMLSVGAPAGMRLRPRGGRDDPRRLRLRLARRLRARARLHLPHARRAEVTHLMASAAGTGRLPTACADPVASTSSCRRLRALPDADHRRDHRLQGAFHRGRSSRTRSSASTASSSASSS